MGTHIFNCRQRLVGVAYLPPPSPSSFLQQRFVEDLDAPLVMYQSIEHPGLFRIINTSLHYLSYKANSITMQQVSNSYHEAMQSTEQIKMNVRS